ncbi:variable surface protein [Plasmodium gonderi]|uniref:Variable surface protein n=1 Tax=Plasmodium gonderi TaxID=77519 RepID=A0A1Y1JTB5_PLAGO|nr:variable surface protein [Plasmodium gonderi]GAW84377.1 variable surface protein [Plasmodium gonderi]
MYNPGNFYDFFNTNFFYISYTDECENLDSYSENVHNDLGKIKGFLDNLINDKINGVNLKEQNCDSFNKWINKKKTEYICNRDNDENHVKEIFPTQFCINTKLDDCCNVEYAANVFNESSSMKSPHLLSTENYAFTYDAQRIKSVYSICFPLLTFSKIKMFLNNKYLKEHSIKNYIQSSCAFKHIEDFFLMPERKRVNIHYPSKV